MRGLPSLLPVMLLLAAYGATPTVRGPTVARAGALVGGTDAPSLVSLTPGQLRSIGRIEVDGMHRCTATLLDARHALTARHCLSSDVDLGLVDFVWSTGAVHVPIVAVERHPELDIAVVTLGASPPEEEAVRVIDLQETPLGPELIGSLMEAAGGGVGTPPSAGIHFGVFRVTAMDSLGMELHADEPRGLCRGDSGGPFLFPGADGTVRLVATSSRGAADCLGPDWGVRVDVVAEWIHRIRAAPLPAPSSPCVDGEPAACVGTVERRCAGGWRRERDCAALGRACGSIGAGTSEGCVSESCGAIDWRGVCVTGAAQWCAAGQVQETDCAARGRGCDWDSSAGGYRCVDCPSCGGACVDLALDPENCGACGVACRLENGAAACEQGQCVPRSCAADFTLDAGTCVRLPEDTTGCRTVGGEPLLALLLVLARRRSSARGRPAQGA